MAGNFLNFYTVLLLSKSKASNVSEVYGNMLLKLYNGHPKCEKNAIFSIFSAVRFLATVMLLNLALRKCWKYQCQFLNVSKTKKKVKKHFYLHFMKKNVLRNTASMCVQDSECCILLLLDTGCSVHCTSWKWLYDQNQDFCFQSSNITISIFFF